MEESIPFKPINLLIVEDQQIIVDGLIMILSGHPKFGEINACTDTKELLHAIDTYKPDVILMDFNMPHMDGMQCIEVVLESNPDQKILMLTGYDDTELIREALRKGALGYVLKNIAKDELIKAIVAVNERKRHLDQQVQNKVVEAFLMNEEHNKVEQPSNKDAFNLSNREIEILKLIAEGKPSSKIADQLFISANTVDTHRKNIMAKCGVKKITELITFANKNQLL
ncbi:response regulator [Sphingobacterium sp. NPDC055346]